MLKQMQINTLLIEYEKYNKFANLSIFLHYFQLSSTAQVFYHSETLQLEAAGLKRGETIWQPKLRILWSNYFLYQHKHTASEHTHTHTGTLSH